MIHIQNYINGHTETFGSPQRAQSYNPYTQQVIASFPLSGPDETNQAVASASTALTAWRALPSVERGCFLRRIADEISQRAEDIAQAITASCGKPVTEARFDVQDSVDCYRYYGQQADKFDDENHRSVDVADDGFSTIMRREACGVVALITPWNFPTVTTSWKLAAALAAGCTAILKPSEITPLAESFLADICNAAGIPAGVVNIIYGHGDSGARLVRHPDVRKVSFTGSTETGARIAHDVADDIKNLSLELGGKSSILVFDDADEDTAINSIMAGIFFNNGQMCSATSRLLIEEAIAARLLPRLKTRIAQLRLGDPQDENTNLGPLACVQQYTKVCNYFDIARAENLQVLSGGDVYEHHISQLMVEPTVYLNVPESSRLWREEIFGPVLCVRLFSSENDAVRMANDCEYGLAATVISADETRAENIACRLEAGHIWINTDQRVLVEASWGGMKKSGLGRELGPWGMNAFTEIKHITRQRK